jgi:hypothetical protein
LACTRPLTAELTAGLTRRPLVPIRMDNDFSSSPMPFSSSNLSSVPCHYGSFEALDVSLGSASGLGRGRCGCWSSALMAARLDNISRTRLRILCLLDVGSLRRNGSVVGGDGVDVRAVYQRISTGWFTVRREPGAREAYPVVGMSSSHAPPIRT